MKKQNQIIIWLVILFLVSTTTVSAYNLGIDVNQKGQVKYSTPTILGDQNQPDGQDSPDVNNPENSPEVSKPEKVDVKETPKIENPEKIEIKNDGNKTQVELRKGDKTQQELNPEKINLEFSASPNSTPSGQSEAGDNGTSQTASSDATLKDRADRANEKVQLQSEVSNNGTVEMQLESRNVKAKINSSQIELDVKNNNIGVTDNQGNKVELVHLPDQAMQKFLDLGVSVEPGTLEVGQSGNTLEYTVDAIKMQKLFGLFAHQTNVKLSLNDSTGAINQQKVATNIIDTILNLFSAN